jgi:uncharacterized protein (DUF2345 family)
MAGGSQIIISSDGITIKTPREFKVFAGQHKFESGEKQSINMPLLPDFGQFQLKNTIGKTIPYTDYILIDEDGNTHSGTTDSEGFTQKIITSKEKKFSVHIIQNSQEDIE